MHYHINHHPASHYTNSLPEALVEDIEDLLEPLVTEVLDPVQAVVGEGHSQRLYTVELLGEGQLRVGQELDIVRGRVKLGPRH